MASQPDTHTKEHAHSSETASSSSAVKKIRELTGNTLSHEEARRLLAECDGDLNVATNRIADGLESWSEVKEHKPKKEKGPKTGKKKEEGARGRGRGGRGGRGGHRPEGGSPAANGSPHPERSGRGGRGGRGGSERGGATQRPAAPAAVAPAAGAAAATAAAPKQPVAQPAPAAPRVIPPPQHYHGLTAAQIVAGAHLQQQAAPQAAPQPQQPAVQSHPAPAALQAPAKAEEAHIAPSHAPVAAQQHVVAAPVSQAPVVAQTAVAAAAPAPAKSEVANGNAANGRRQQNGKPKEERAAARPPRTEAHGAVAPGAAAKPVFVLPSSVSGHSADIQFGSFGMTPLSENLPAVHQAKPAVYARAPAHAAPGANSHQHVTETSAQSVRPESGYHAHEAHAAEQQPQEDAGVPQLPHGYMYPPFMPVPFGYEGDAGMRPYYDPAAAFGGAPYRAAAGSPVGDSKLSPQQHLAEGGAGATGSASAQANPQHVGYNSQYFGYYPPYLPAQAGHFYPGNYNNARAYKPGAYGYPAPQSYGTPEGGDESYGKYAPHAYNPPATAPTAGSKQSLAQFASPPATPLDAYNKSQDYASKGYNNREGAAAQYAYQGYPAYYPMHMAQYGGQPQGQSSQPAGRSNQ